MDIAVEEPEVSGAAEIAAVLIAAHPHGNSVAVAIAIAIGSGLLFDLRFGNWKALFTFMAAS
jgi:tRNA (guanine-N(7)-)-methyltransferase subunit TRM82